MKAVKIFDIIQKLGDLKPKQLSHAAFTILSHLHHYVRQKGTVTLIKEDQLAKRFGLYGFVVEAALKELRNENMANYPKLLIKGYDLVEHHFQQCAEENKEERKYMHLSANDLHEIQKLKYEFEYKRDPVKYYVRGFQK